MERAICEPLRPRTGGLTASLRNVLQTLHNDAVEPTVYGGNGLQIAHSRTPRARQFSGARMERASARFAIRYGRGRAV
eukprot:2438167-Lingulodinium_polyedra.AAC.1